VPRVLFAIGGLQMGGSERQLVELLTRAHPTQISATVVTWDAAHPTHARRLADAGIPHVSLGRLPSRRALRPPVVMARLGQIVRRVRPHAVYPWLDQAAALLVPVARAHGIPALVGRRNTCGAAVEQGNPLAAAIIQRIERMATLVTANSEAVVEAALQRGVSSDRLRLIRNGHVSQPPLPQPGEPPVTIGYVAAFRPEKGHRRFVSTIEQLRSDVPWRVDLAGSGSLQPAVAREIDRAGLGDRVQFVGAVEDIRSFWAERSIAALFSDYEGSPNALIEAAFAGRALVGTDVGGTREVVQPEGGVLVPLDDPSAAARALQSVIESAGERARYGRAAHQQAEQRFSMDRFVQGHMGAIREALAA